jgi:hypothetical protein
VRPVADERDGGLDECCAVQGDRLAEAARSAHFETVRLEVIDDVGDGSRRARGAAHLATEERVRRIVGAREGSAERRTAEEEEGEERDAWMHRPILTM